MELWTAVNIFSDPPGVQVYKEYPQVWLGTTGDNKPVKFVYSSSIIESDGCLNFLVSLRRPTGKDVGHHFSLKGYPTKDEAERNIWNEMIVLKS